ncbi:MAG: methyltransferase domain-containing protein [Bacteroidota bacterium]
MAKKPFIRKQKRKRHGATFWDNEYTEGGNLKLSVEASGDLMKFMRWLERQKAHDFFVPESAAVDLGCGNGRNLVYLARDFGMHGTGYDISTAAIAQARAMAGDLPLAFEARSMAGDITLPDNSQALALDMMSSHFLNTGERTHMKDEVHRVLAPGGWFFFKTFLLDGDLHTKRLLEERPGKEPNSYIHPVIGVPEFVYSEKELVEWLEESFIVHKAYRSHKHISKGKARKRRTISIYAQKDPYR